MHDDRLQRLLGGPERAQLRLKLRARFERGSVVDGFSLTGLNSSERAALEGLLGRAPRHADSISLSHHELDHAVRRADLADNLRHALEKLDGPIADRRAEKDRIEADWNALLAKQYDVRLRAMLSEPSGVALLKRCASGEPKKAVDLIVCATRILERLPARGISRAQLAAEVLGDAHALDPGQPVAALVLRACRNVTRSSSEIDLDDAAAQIPMSEDIGSTVDVDEATDRSIRSQWAAVGIAVNELSAPVLLLNVPVFDDSSSDDWVRAASREAQPLHLSLRTLLRLSPAWNVQNVVVSICENPSIVAAAADRLRMSCAPLICTDGMPGAAQRTLMRQLTDAGAKLRYHGDFDWAGLRIGNFVIGQCNAIPWRFSASDYLATTRFIGRQLDPTACVDASWDASLKHAMLEQGREVHEEQLIESLLQDLSSAL